MAYDQFDEVDLGSILIEMGCLIDDAGIRVCVQKHEICYPDSPNPSYYMRLESHRYVSDFQIWKGSRTYAAILWDLASSSLRIDIDKSFADVGEALNCGRWIISILGETCENSSNKANQTGAPSGSPCS